MLFRQKQFARECDFFVLHIYSKKCFKYEIEDWTDNGMMSVFYFIDKQMDSLEPIPWREKGIYAIVLLIDSQTSSIIKQIYWFLVSEF